MSRKRNRRLEREGVRAMDGEKLYKLSQVADAANVSIRTVQNHVEKGALKVQRVGPFNRPRVRESELRKYLGAEPEQD